MRDFGQSAQSSYGCPAACHSSVEWVSGQKFFYARRQREGNEGPLRNRHLRRSGATGGDIKCFRQRGTAVPVPPLCQSKIAVRLVRNSQHGDSPWSSWASGCLRDENAERMSERAICMLPICTLALAGTPGRDTTRVISPKRLSPSTSLPEHFHPDWNRGAFRNGRHR